MDNTMRALANRTTHTTVRIVTAKLVTLGHTFLTTLVHVTVMCGPDTVVTEVY